MFNAQEPSENDLPTSGQLLKSTIIAFGVAIVLLFTIILPAEFGYDPTSIGETLGVKKMGNIKTNLNKEAIEEETIGMGKSEQKLELTKNHDRIAVKIAPNEAIEIKLEMRKGASAQFQWTATDGSLNFNLHGDGYKGTHKSITYKKGKMVSSDKGKLVAEFNGYHGWFWRNRNNETVTINLETMGDYIQLKRIR